MVHIIGLPSVLKVGSRLAIFYDGNGSGQMPGGVKSHMDRDVGLAWINLPIIPPGEGADKPAASPKITVASYYFGNYHPGDSRNARMKGKDWSEWELVKAAKPRFPGHQQPKVPLWGYADESDPKVMAQKIAAAADHGINAFIFDWYYYNDGPFLERPMTRFLGTNNHRLKFAFMWATTGRRFSPTSVARRRRCCFGKGHARELRKDCDHLIKITSASVLLADRRTAYFSFYE
jgi:hypothetical protein